MVKLPPDFKEFLSLLHTHRVKYLEIWKTGSLLQSVLCSAARLSVVPLFLQKVAVATDPNSLNSRPTTEKDTVRKNRNRAVSTS